mmetsp:Transcript_54214/g.172082  ORF Transcript_54214/g.172082 Transcript_54214/m.172082 type:complete len:200 (-) Transcript_54214:38-637(-)
MPTLAARPREEVAPARQRGGAPRPSIELAPGGSFSRGGDTSSLDALLIDLCREVNGHLGANNLEATYQRALKLELEGRGLRVEEEVEIELVYKGWRVGTRRADLIVHQPSGEKAVLELKAVAALNLEHQKQLQYYLAHLGISTGYRSSSTSRTRQASLPSRAPWPAWSSSSRRSVGRLGHVRVRVRPPHAPWTIRKSSK